MPLDCFERPSLQEQVTCLNAQLGGMDALAMLDTVLGAPELGRLALVSSFGADSVVLLHMVSQIDLDTPVIFIDTRMLFEETLTYQQEVAAQLGLRNIKTVRPRHVSLLTDDPRGDLHKTDPNACCALRKTAPLQEALHGFDGWITGRKRHQSASRSAIPLVEVDGTRMKINPLADWAAGELAAYIKREKLPSHPLVKRGYPSIGCAPCTAPATDPDDPRSGRWAGQDKVECGIHFTDSGLQRGPVQKAS